MSQNNVFKYYAQFSRSTILKTNKSLDLLCEGGVTPSPPPPPSDVYPVSHPQQILLFIIF